MAKENQKAAPKEAAPKERKAASKETAPKEKHQAAPKEALPKDYAPRLKAAYKKVVLPELLKELKAKSPMAVPRLTKIVINMGVSEAKDNVQALDLAKEDLAQITGQAPQIRRAKKSISNFKLREGMPIGARVTLRGNIMYEFMDRFIAIACPRIRDFQGFDAKCFDGRGNFNIGLKEHHIFPEINMEKSPTARGMNITFVTTAGKDEGGKLLLGLLGMPFRKTEKRN